MLKSGSVWTFMFLIVTFTSAFSDDTLSRHKRLIPSISNRCDGSVVSISELKAKLHHWRYPDTYRQGVCKWHIEVPAHMFVNVHVLSLWTSCYCHDTLRVVDGTGYVHLDDTCGDYSKPVKFNTLSNSFDVTFTATRNSNEKNGFLMVYVARDIVGVEWDPCAGGGKQIKLAEGQESSPGYSTGKYGPNLDCKWRLQVATEDNLLLRLNMFEVELSNVCENDWLKIYDGEDESKPLIGTYCGRAVYAASIKSSRSFLFLHFHTDELGEAKGFSFSWQTLKGSPANDESESGCGAPHSVRGTSGVITSPNYGASYPAQSDCKYSIVVASGAKVQINITHLDIEYERNCRFDGLAIFDGMNTNAAMLYPSVICGKRFLGSIPTSTYNHVFIAFDSDLTREGDGFRLLWEEIRDVSVSGMPCSQDGQLLTSIIGIIKSPGYDDDDIGYPNNADCKWTIQAPEGGQVVISWQFVDIEYEGLSCGYDAVDIYDSAMLTSRLLRRLCGGNGSINLPDNIKSSGRNILIHLHSDQSTNKRGFVLTFNTYPPDTQENASWPGCNGSVLALRPGSLFSSPYYNGERQYGAYVHCSWLLIADEGSHMSITFERMDIEDDVKGCLADSVKIHNGPSPEHYVSAIHCGRQNNLHVYIRNHQAYVTFTSDATLGKAGFTATWKQVDVQPAFCGQASRLFPIKSQMATAQRIIGGTEANQHSLPWQVYITSAFGYLCGGSIISPDWILTAAHCVRFRVKSVVAGAHDLKAPDIDSQQVRAVDYTVKHPEYNEDIFNNDYALIRVQKPFVFNDFVQAICLARHPVTAGTMCLTSGWGVTDDGVVPNRLMQVYLPIISQSECRKWLGYVYTPQMFCAGGNRVDACPGDSGGPMICKSATSETTLNTSIWELHGVTSWGWGKCGETNKPGVWAQVTIISGWIQQVTGNHAPFAN